MFESVGFVEGVVILRLKGRVGTHGKSVKINIVYPVISVLLYCLTLSKDLSDMVGLCMFNRVGKFTGGFRRKPSY